MATASFGRCPHCSSPITFLEGVTGATMKPVCPRCRKVIEVTTATLIAADYSQASR
jgi:hypothetical protein